jgi:hypothetical protein
VSGSRFLYPSESEESCLSYGYGCLAVTSFSTGLLASAYSNPQIGHSFEEVNSWCLTNGFHSAPTSLRPISSDNSSSASPSPSPSPVTSNQTSIDVMPLFRWKSSSWIGGKVRSPEWVERVTVYPNRIAPTLNFTKFEVYVKSQDTNDLIVNVKNLVNSLSLFLSLSHD